MDFSTNSKKSNYRIKTIILNEFKANSNEIFINLKIKMRKQISITFELLFEVIENIKKEFQIKKLFFKFILSFLFNNKI